MEYDALIARGLQILLALGGAYLLALWFTLIVWAFRDIESRSRSVVTQVFSTLLVVLFWLPGLALYYILRPKETLEEAYQRSLEEEYLLQDLEEVPLCPSCNRFVEDDFMLCPHCQTQLKDNCHNCQRLVDLRWPVCPYCGDHQAHHEHHDDALEKVDSPGDRWIDPDVIEQRLRRQQNLREQSEHRALPMVTASFETVRDLLGEPYQQTTTSSAAAPVVEEAEPGTSETPETTEEQSEPGPTSIPKRFKVH